MDRLHVRVSPGIYQEELSDANWLTWLVIAHEDPAKLEDQVLYELRDRFLDENPEPEQTGPDYDPFDKWNQEKDIEFLRFADRAGYTVFNTITGLIWL